MAESDMSPKHTSPIVVELVDTFLAGGYTVLEQDNLVPGHGTVTIRNVDRLAYRDQAGKVWYFSGTGANVKKKAGSAMAATFQLERRK